MKIYTETSLRDFEAWSGAVDTLDTLIEKDLVDDLEAIIDDEAVSGAEGWDDTSLNDFLWFETDTIAEWLGFSSWEDLENDGEEEEEEEEELTEEEQRKENEDFLCDCLHDGESFTYFCDHCDCDTCPFVDDFESMEECHKKYDEILADYIKGIERIKAVK